MAVAESSITASASQFLRRLKSREEWLAMRHSFIGSSDAAIILNASPFKSRYALWAEKIGDAVDDDLSDVEFVQWGNRLQGVILDAYAEKTGRSAFPVHPYEIALPKNPELSFMGASLDGEQWIDGRRCPVEIKAVGVHQKYEWKDEPPLHYQVQCQHQMAVIDAPMATIVVLIGGQKMLHFDLERNDRFIDTMIDEESKFWQLVVERRPPEPVDGSYSTSRAIAQLYPRGNGEVVELDEQYCVWADKYLKANALLKRIEGVKEEAANNLKAAIGPNAAGLLPDGREITYYEQSRNGYTVQPSTFRVLRMPKHQKPKLIIE